MTILDSYVLYDKTIRNVRGPNEYEHFTLVLLLYCQQVVSALLDRHLSTITIFTQNLTLKYFTIVSRKYHNYVSHKIIHAQYILYFIHF